MTKATKKINLALQGGGSHGAFTWGVVDALLQCGRIEIDSISSTSAGSMNAAIITQGLINGGPDGARQALMQFWRDLSDIGSFLSPVQMSTLESLLGITAEQNVSYLMFDMMTKVLSPYEFNPFNFNPLRQLLDKYIDIDLIKKSKINKLFVCATNVRTGKIKVFQNEEISINAILASTCLPFLFQAVKIDGEYYWDGGYTGNPPIFPLIYNSNVRDVLIIHINPIVRPQIPKTAADIMNRINEISFNSSLIREMRAIAFVTKMLDDDWIKDEFRQNIKKINVHAIRTDSIMTKYSVASKFETDWVFLTHLFELGQQMAYEWLDNNFDSIGEKSSIDLNDFL